MENIKIIQEKCTGCKKCLSICPQDAIKIKNKKAVVTADCNLCGLCRNSCQFEAIQFASKNTFEKDLSLYRGIWVLAETEKTKVKEVVFELMGKGKDLARELNTELSVILSGRGMTDEINKLIAYGADKIYLLENLNLNTAGVQIYTEIIVQLVERYKPEIFLLGATPRGRSLAPRIASRLDTGLTADCTELEINKEKKNLLQIRPAFGGNLMAKITTPAHRPQMATVRPKVMETSKPDYTLPGKIIKPEIHISNSHISNNNIEIIKINQEKKIEMNLSEANIIIAGGRGMEKPQNLKLLEELADILGGEVGASRAIVEDGWIDSSHQVGQSGSTVSPELYFACGISGAIQHQAGMSSSDIIIAINKDPEAPIFDIANYGIIGDTLEVLPALIEEFKKR
ncbi:MAG: FAD-binding protein [Halanaerobiales bacterium]